MVSSLIFQKFSGEGLTEPPPQTPPPAFSRASPSVRASPSILGRFAPSTRASPSILGRFAPSIRASPSTFDWGSWFGPQSKFLDPPVYVPPSPKIFPKPNFARLFRSMTQSIVPNIFSIGSLGCLWQGVKLCHFQYHRPIKTIVLSLLAKSEMARGREVESSVNRGWPLQLLYYRTTVMWNRIVS